MKTYLFYTMEGYTESPNSNSIENCQLLGEAKGETVEDAFVCLLKNNTWIRVGGIKLIKDLNDYPHNVRL